MYEPDGNTAAGLLRFTGERKRPMRPEEIARIRPELGDGQVPTELAELAGRRSVYVRSSGDERPQVDVNQVEDQSDLWRVDVAMDHPVALLGRTGERRAPEDFLGEIDPNVGFNSYRPSWVDVLPMPRTIPDPTDQPMRRLNRRRLVRPFDTTRFPPEERRVYQDAAWPWGLVCKIFTSAGKTGSAALVGNRVAVTAGHMIPPGGSWWIRLVPDYFDGASLHGAGVQSYVSDWRGYQQNGVVGYDWAILRLFEPLGASLGFFGSNSYDDDWEDEPYWTHAGYPGAINSERPSWQGSVSIFDDDSDDNGGEELETRADMSPGNSGGPLWGWWGNEPRLIGVVSGEEYDSAFPSGEWGNVVAGGSGFHNLVSWGRTNWP
jgi:hypothetical protein